MGDGIGGEKRPGLDFAHEFSARLVSRGRDG